PESGFSIMLRLGFGPIKHLCANTGSGERTTGGEMRQISGLCCWCAPQFLRFPLEGQCPDDVSVQPGKIDHSTGDFLCDEVTPEGNRTPGVDTSADHPGANLLKHCKQLDQIVRLGLGHDDPWSWDHKRLII